MTRLCFLSPFRGKNGPHWGKQKTKNKQQCERLRMCGEYLLFFATQATHEYDTYGQSLHFPYFSSFCCSSLKKENPLRHTIGNLHILHSLYSSIQPVRELSYNSITVLRTHKRQFKSTKEYSFANRKHILLSTVHNNPTVTPPPTKKRPLFLLYKPRSNI